MLNLALPRASLRAHALEILRRFADRVAVTRRRRSTTAPPTPRLVDHEPSLWILHAR
jgi:ABC-type microcin C transport system duplicated ATPase subunit YejF